MANEQDSEQLQRLHKYGSREFGHRPDHDDVVIEVYGSERLHRKGLVARMEAVEQRAEANEKANEETSRQFKGILANAKWLLIGLGINLAANLPSAIEWIVSRLP